MLGWLVTAPLAVLRWLISPIPLTVIAVLAAWAYYSISKRLDFWKSRGVPGPKPRLPWGTEYGSPFSAVTEFESWLYNEHGGKKFCGFLELQQPVLFVGDLDLIRAITIKDFEHFPNQRDHLGTDFWKETLILLKGAEWKETRAVMSPTFSASKLKAMHQLTLDNAQNLTKYLQKQMKEEGQVEIKDAFGRFTMDNIAACAFGVDCNSFVDPNSQFAKNAAKFTNFPPIMMLRFVAETFLPYSIARWFPDYGLKVGAFFADVVMKTIAHREKNPSSTRDFLQLLMDTKDKDGKRILSDSSIVAQSSLFLVAGYDTTSMLLTFAGFCLALNQEIQERVQQEIDEALERHGGLTYEAIQDMPYLDRVISETLRLYPPATRMERVCAKEYTLPDTDIQIPAGTLVYMPVFAMHRDPELYPDPLQFDPDRFLPEEKEKRHPCAYIPFGNGPRNCIAMRFALFEAKVALVSVLRELTLKPAPETPPHPMPLDPDAFLTTPKDRKVPLLAVPRQAAAQ
ncbi:Cytochrome P450 3A31 [Amphibalanus amphitrite]|uniref:Cytochrome P450 3A31 n=1 Tax=Amphibalanus amphitrite TaxID=1232801 RepID=A0A6A4W8Q5_AMPAM|nr:Cytochrome P450 3A31 [Amphibalanus amphitrite]